MFKIVSRISVAGVQNITQTKLITRNFVLINQEGQDHVFLNQTNSYYLVDRENEYLKKINFTIPAAHIRKLRRAIGRIDHYEMHNRLRINNIPSRCLRIKNAPNDRISIAMKVYIGRLEGLEHTAHKSYHRFDSRLQLVNLFLKPNEIPIYQEIDLHIHNVLFEKQKILVSHIEPVEEDCHIFQDYLAFASI